MNPPATTDKDTARVHPGNLEIVVDILQKLFSADDLRDWLRRSTDPRLSAWLPGAPVAPRELMSKATELLAQYGLLDATFFTALVAERPRRACCIELARRRWFGEAPMAMACAANPCLWDGPGSLRRIGITARWRRWELLIGCTMLTVAGATFSTWWPGNGAPDPVEPPSAIVRDPAPPTSPPSGVAPPAEPVEIARAEIPGDPPQPGLKKNSAGFPRSEPACSESIQLEIFGYLGTHASAASDSREVSMTVLVVDHEVTVRTVRNDDHDSTYRRRAERYLQRFQLRQRAVRCITTQRVTL